jgi:hypothetical protein
VLVLGHPVDRGDDLGDVGRPGDVGGLEVDDPGVGAIPRKLVVSPG